MSLKTYIVTTAYDAGHFGQSDELFLLYSSENRIIGYSSEFEVCTDTIEAAYSELQHSSANWFSWNKTVGWIPATMEQVEAAGLLNHVKGYKEQIKLGTPILPLS